MVHEPALMANLPVEGEESKCFGGAVAYYEEVFCQCCDSLEVLYLFIYLFLHKAKHALHLLFQTMIMNTLLTSSQTETWQTDWWPKSVWHSQFMALIFCLLCFSRHRRTMLQGNSLCFSHASYQNKASVYVPCLSLSNPL